MKRLYRNLEKDHNASDYALENLEAMVNLATYSSKELGIYPADLRIYTISNLVLEEDGEIYTEQTRNLDYPQSPSDWDSFEHFISVPQLSDRIDQIKDNSITLLESSLINGDLNTFYIGNQEDFSHAQDYLAAFQPGENLGYLEKLKYLFSERHAYLNFIEEPDDILELEEGNLGKSLRDMANVNMSEVSSEQLDQMVEKLEKETEGDYGWDTV